MKTKILVSAEHPEGWTLEDLMTEIQNDIMRRSQNILEDNRPEARQVLRNNIDILGLLTDCIEKARESTAVLKSLGPHVDGEPRIGVL